MNESDWRMISQIPGNDHCLDCYAQHPEWASLEFGILICTRCCGRHRSLPQRERCYSSNKSPPQVVVVSSPVVQSVRLDETWSSEHIQRLKVGGNQRFRDWLTSDGCQTNHRQKEKEEGSSSEMARPFSVDYTAPKSLVYADVVLPARLQGLPEPQSWQQYQAQTTNHSHYRVYVWCHRCWMSSWWWWWARSHQKLPGTTNYFQKNPRSNTLINRFYKTMTHSETYLTAYVITLLGTPLLFFWWYYFYSVL